MNKIKLLTTSEVAAELGLSTPRVLALIYAGRLPAEKIGRQWLIRPKDVDLVRERKTGRPRKEATTTQ